MTKHEKNFDESMGESIDKEEIADEMDRLKDISHTPPIGDGANRVWDGTRVFDGEDEDDE